MQRCLPVRRTSRNMSNVCISCISWEGVSYAETNSGEIHNFRGTSVYFSQNHGHKATLKALLLVWGHQPTTNWSWVKIDAGQRQKSLQNVKFQFWGNLGPKLLSFLNFVCTIAEENIIIDYNQNCTFVFVSWNPKFGGVALTQKKNHTGSFLKGKKSV